jgi:hypothetical protein
MAEYEHKKGFNSHDAFQQLFNEAVKGHEYEHLCTVFTRAMVLRDDYSLGKERVGGVVNKLRALVYQSVMDIAIIAMERQGYVPLPKDMGERIEP